MNKDRRAISTTTSGEPPEPGHDYQGAPAPIDPRTGQHRSYWILTPEERAKGFVAPVRNSYRHAVCGGVTTMSQAIAETYARDPSYYGATFCSTCMVHLAVGEHGQFFWTDNPTEKVGTLPGPCACGDPYQAHQRGGKCAGAGEDGACACLRYQAPIPEVPRRAGPTLKETMPEVFVEAIAAAALVLEVLSQAEMGGTALSPDLQAAIADATTKAAVMEMVG